MTNIVKLDILAPKNRIVIERPRRAPYELFAHSYYLTPRRVLAIARACRHTNRFDLITAQNERRRLEREHDAFETDVDPYANYARQTGNHHPECQCNLCVYDGQLRSAEEY